MSHNRRAGQASNQATVVGQVNAGRSTQRGQVGGNAPSRGNCFFESRARQNDRLQHCQLVPDQPLQGSQLFFGCWRSLRSCARRRPVYRRQGAGNSLKETSDEGAPQGHFLHRRPLEERQGLDGLERARTIRRTAAKKRRRRQNRARAAGALRRRHWTQQPAAPADAR